jgi:Fur family transcriptional regulator, ferric uptake regulator
MDAAISLLVANHLTKTPCRVDMIAALLNSETALTEQEIKQKIMYDYDRATIFRNLRAFLKSGLIHAVSLEGGEVRYQLSQSRAKSAVHAHFHCKLCSNLYCLNESSIQGLSLPSGFVADDYDIVIKGLCSHCGVTIDEK